MQKYSKITDKAPHLVKSFIRVFKNSDGVEEQLFHAIKKHSKNNPCINCQHSRADILKAKKSEMTPWITDRVCFYNLKNIECAPIKKEDPDITKELISELEKNIEKLIMSYVYRLQRLRVEFKKSDLIRALILITVNEKSNKCLNCKHSKANKTKFLERLKEAKRLEIYTRTCSFGLTPKVCEEYCEPFIDSSARKQIKLRNEILEG